jgi:hypothetical protein
VHPSAVTSTLSTDAIKLSRTLLAAHTMPPVRSLATHIASHLTKKHAIEKSIEKVVWRIFAQPPELLIQKLI